MKDFRMKTVRGFVGDATKSVIPKPCQATVRLTSDKKGQTLSIQAYNVIIGIPLEEVSEIIRISERGAK